MSLGEHMSAASLNFAWDTLQSHSPSFTHTFPFILHYTCLKNMQNPERKKEESTEAVMNSSERSWGLIDL